MTVGTGGRRLRMMDFYTVAARLLRFVASGALCLAACGATLVLADARPSMEKESAALAA